MDREDRQMTREEVQKVVDELMPGLKLPAPRTEEEFLAELKPIPELEEPAYMKAFPKFVTLSEQTRSHVLKMILTAEEYEQVVELYEKERTLKNEMG